MIAEFDPYVAIEEAEGTTDSKLRATLLKSAIEYLMSHGDTESANVHYAIGYAWYLYPTESLARDNEVVSHLKEALRIKPEHKYARLYLAHQHFDHQQFSSALALLDGFDPLEFSNADQAWRDVKVAEMILCCRLYLSDMAKIREALRRFCEALTNLEPGMHPEPEELTMALIALVTGFKSETNND